WYNYLYPIGTYELYDVKYKPTDLGRHFLREG
ncbi:MAG: hypothetical protein ACI9AH_001211, partial [Oceanospirillaceae bacterium]